MSGEYSSDNEGAVNTIENVDWLLAAEGIAKNTPDVCQSTVQ